jgi:hypothetical protein
VISDVPSPAINSPVPVLTGAGLSPMHQAPGGLPLEYLTPQGSSGGYGALTASDIVPSGDSGQLPDWDSGQFPNWDFGIGAANHVQHQGS